MQRSALILLFGALLAALAAPVHAHKPGGGHPTSATVSCLPDTIDRGGSTTCTVTLTDIFTGAVAAPQGTVDFSSSVDGAFGSCTLSGISGDSSSCTRTFNPSTADTHTITASYPAQEDANHSWAAVSATTTLVVNPAPPASLAIIGQPTNTAAGQAIQRAGGGGIQVEVRNTLGERITSGNGSSLAVTMAIQTNAGGGTLSGTTTVNAVAGVATFSDLSINKAGNGYRLRATGSGVSGANTSTFDITAAAASQLSFAQEPGDTIAGEPIGVTVRVVDQFGNVVQSGTGSDAPITAAIATNPAGGSLSGTTTVAAVNGVATFTDLAIDKAGEGYTLQVSNPTYGQITSSEFNILVGSAAQLAFGEAPPDTVAGQVIGGVGGVSVRVEDSFGNLVTGSEAQITVAIGNNPGGASLQGTLTRSAVGGVATFDNLAINTAASGYTLTATASGLVSGSSAPFDIFAASAAQLAFAQPPTNNNASEPVTPAVTVRVEDSFGNLVDDGRTIRIRFGQNPGATTLQGTLEVAAVNGVATFNDLQINIAEPGYTLVAETLDSSLTPVESAPFTIAPGAPVTLSFSQHPTNTTAGNLISPAITVEIHDSEGNLVTGSTQAVTLAIGSNPGGGTLSGSTTVNAVSGVATFSTLSINFVGAGYTLVASATSLSSATSNPFEIIAGNPATLHFEQQPSDAVAGQTISGQFGGLTVHVKDAAGNLVTDTSVPVTVAIEFDAGGIDTPLLGNTTVNTIDGVASFPDLAIERAGDGYTLNAASGSLTGDISSSFSITPASATQLEFGVQPSNTTAGATIAPAVTVRVLDEFDNRVTDSSAAVSIALSVNPSSGVLGGGGTVNAVNGIATFSGLFINTAGTGYKLGASGSGLTSVQSNAFNIITGSAAKLGFTTQPSNTPLLENISPAVQVEVQDAQGNHIEDSSASVSILIDDNPGGADLLGTVTVNAVNGTATFSDLQLNRTANGYTLQANSSGLTSAVSASFDITPGAPQQLAFAQQPQTTPPNTNMTPWPSVQAQDADGNPTQFSGNIAIALGNPRGAILSGTTTVTAVDGTATFNDLQIDLTNTDYTLLASSGTLVGATSTAFAVQDANFTFTSLFPDSGPSSGGTKVVIEGSGFGGASTGDYQVVFGNENPAPAVNSFHSNALGCQEGTNARFCVNSPPHPPGLVNVLVRQVATGSTRALQDVFTYTSSGPARVRFSQQPTDIQAGSNFSPDITVEIQDSNGNLVNNATNTVTLAFQENPPGGELLGTKIVQAVDGVATFSGLTVDKAGTGYRLIATADGLESSLPSNAFSATGGNPAALAFDQQPTNNDPGVPITPDITIEVRDDLDNLVTSSNASVTIAIGTNAGAGALSGGTTVTAVDGVATFSTLSIDKAGNGYTLIASADTLESAESATFDINFGSPSRLTITETPGNGVAGELLTPEMVVRVEDSLGNLVEDFEQPIEVTIEENAGGGTLGGTLSLTPVDGIATFGDLVLDLVGSGYTLRAGAFGLESDVSDPFDITHNVPAALVFDVHPDDASQNAVIVPAAQVRVNDAFGNHVTDSTLPITVSIGNNPGGGVLSGTLTRNAANGLASFNDLVIDAFGDGYTLLASSSGLVAGQSDSFNIIAVGGSFNAFSPDTPEGAVVGHLRTAVAGEQFSIDVVAIAEDGNSLKTNFQGTITVQMLDSSVNTGSLQAGGCRSSWSVIQENTGIDFPNSADGRLRGDPVTVPGLSFTEANAWPNVRFRIFPTSGTGGTGCSNDAFSIRPAAFGSGLTQVGDDDWQTTGTARSLLLPDNQPSPNGGNVHAAGRPFRIQVTAVNAQGNPTTNYQGTPEIELIERLLPDACAGCPATPVLTSGWGPVSGQAGSVRTNQALYHDAGAVTVRVIDDSFSAVDQNLVDLGIQPAGDLLIASESLHIGRFVPDHFALQPANTPQLETMGMTCEPQSRSFTYIGQGFGYATPPQALVSARSANGALTPSYRDELWKLTAENTQQEYSHSTVPAGAGTLDTSLATETPSLVEDGGGTGTFTVNSLNLLSFERDELQVVDGLLETPPVAFDASISLTLRVHDDAEAAVAGNGQINTGIPGLFADMAFDSGNEFRYGRLRLINVIGSELDPLQMPYRIETWQEVAEGLFTWRQESEDFCTSFATQDFAIQNIQNSGSVNLDPQITDLSRDTDESENLLGGRGIITIGEQVEGATGSFEVFGQASAVPSYLLYKWNTEQAETGPTGKAAFGINEGNPRHIYRSQSFGGGQ